jgi:glycosyltransferase involved in cell wall biosynthesis
MVYHCVDPIVGDYDSKHGVDAEKIILKNSDVVICTSRALYEEKKKQNINTYFVPNGADITGSISPTVELIAHEALQKIPRPIVGYIGAIERRIDYELIKSVAAQNLAVSFVFVGPLYNKHIPDWFHMISNVHIIDPIQYSEVASMIFGFDVCMIPFKKDAVSNTIFPLKLFEYLGVGKPVICTDFNMDLSEFSGDEVVSYVKNAEEFSIALADCIGSDSPILKEKRIQIALKNTWQDRVNRISKILIDNLKV